jgi:hypothetical protein
MLAYEADPPDDGDLADAFYEDDPNLDESDDEVLSDRITTDRVEK